MIKSRFSQGGESKSIKTHPLDQVSDDLGSPFYSFEKLELLNEDGKFAVKYKNTGSILLGNLNEKETKTVKNTGQIVTWELDYPHIISIHDNDVLQIVNVETGFSDRLQKDKDTLKKVQCILVSNQTIYCISSNQVSLYEKSNLNGSAQREIPIQDFSNDKVRPIINVNRHFSYLRSPNHLVLGNADVFQCWHLSQAKNEMTMEFEGRNVNSQIKYFGVYSCNNSVVTTNRENFSVWSVSKPLEAAKNPRELRESDIITTAYLDDTFLIMGTSLGLVSLRQRSNGEKLYDLNVIDGGATLAANKNEGSLLNVTFDYKINRIEKFGRWIFAISENSKLNVFDVTVEKGDPIYQYQHAKGGAIRDMLIGKNGLFLVVKHRTDTSSSSKSDKSGDKGKKKKEKPEVVQLFPKLPGFEYFYNLKKTMNVSGNVFNASSPTSPYSFQTKEGFGLTSVLTYSCLQISEHLNDIAKAGEDVTEFTSIIERVNVCLSQVLRCQAEYSFSFVTLRPLQTSLDEYQSLLEKLTNSGRLVRFFTSSRLRRGLEVQNSAVHSKLNDIEEIIKGLLAEKAKSKAPVAVSSPTTPAEKSAVSPPVRPSLRNVSSSASLNQAASPLLNSSGGSTSPSGERTRGFTSFPAAQSMISDDAGKEFWSNYFGSALMVEWHRFLMSLKKIFTNMTTLDDMRLQGILDHGNTGYISQYRFSEFLKGFGPFPKCVQNVKSVLDEKWFHGFLSSREAELLMKNSNEPEGTFLVRFSKSKPGSFAMAFVKGNQVRHILIESNMPTGLSVSEQEGANSGRYFPSLQDIVTHYNFVLKYPFQSTLPQKVWFHGDISADESNELLSEQPAGTFLIRFSSKGTFAASFVDPKGSTRHVLITSPKKDCFEVNTGDAESITFPSIKDLVNYYNGKGVFKIPLKTENQEQQEM
eukprot:TRINITY_DN3359_c0_g1_i1.p1 TRINITY_DN3359_c0_g1~~TRINITY_DN3359_c0_g1_i1.p1  ORF type:complete len:922 (-),score=285.01 TRINITY_DN3359_c0_g1_i1:87-2852(-)